MGCFGSGAPPPSCLISRVGREDGEVGRVLSDIIKPSYSDGKLL
jgi:hypothetical protein